ncbi:MAG TPA: glycosyltransferase family 39 protein [Candidatus Saccharimonadia bacterium]|nr:glycosyltransferase family 39 protein [Candidatus Saccharimonadia bacterium]
MHRQRFLLPALVVLTVARLLLLAQTALSETEQQVLQHAREGHLWHAGLGPLLPWLVRVSTFVFGEGAFGVRFFAPLLMLGAGWLLWMLVRGFFDVTTASWALLVFQITPAVNLAAVTMTHTTLGIALSVGVMAALRVALHRDYRFHLQWWLLALAFGVVFLADWRLSMISLAGIASIVVTSRGRRAILKWPVLPVLGVSLGVMLAWFFWWNAKHDWPAFAEVPQSTPASWWQKIVTVPVAFSPLLLAACGWALVKSALPKPMPYSVATLQAYVWPLVLLDVLCWLTFPSPFAGVSAWLAPTIALLAHVSVNYDAGPMKQVRWVRAVVIGAAALQSLWLMSGGLQKMLGLAW